jgi:hypothetical protein
MQRKEYTEAKPRLNKNAEVQVGICWHLRLELPSEICGGRGDGYSTSEL